MTAELLLFPTLCLVAGFVLGYLVGVARGLKVPRG